MKKLLSFSLPLLLGIAIVVVAVSNRKPPEKLEHVERARAARTVEAATVDLVPVARGFGEVRPSQVWAAVAQVAGRITEIHPKLRNGQIILAQNLLYRIDPADYELSVAQAQAELAELDAREANSRASLTISLKDLEIARREQERIAALRDSGSVASSELDSANRSLLTAQSAVQRDQSELALIPAQRRAQQARLQQAQRDLANTEVRAPFDMRVANLVVEREQYVGIGQQLFEGDDISRVEIIAQIPLPSLRNLLRGQAEQTLSTSRLTADLTAISGFDPIVELEVGDSTASWQAQFVRFSDQVDPNTRTVGVVVAVDSPFDKAILGKRPPLTKGMFVEVSVRGRVQPKRLIVPRWAVRQGQVYLVDSTQRLQLRDVDVLFEQDTLAVVTNGINPGDRIVVSDLVPVVAGMLIDPRPDAVVQRELIASGVRR